MGLGLTGARSGPGLHSGLLLRWLAAGMAGAAAAALAAWLWPAPQGASAADLVCGTATRPRVTGLLLVAVAVQGAVGLALRPRARGGTPRERVAAVLIEAGAAALCALLPVLAAAWALAARSGHAALALDAWGSWDGNHGPWRRAVELRALLGAGFRLPLASLAAALASLAVRPARSAAVLFALAAAAGWGLLGTHYWLVD